MYEKVIQASYPSKYEKKWWETHYQNLKVVNESIVFVVSTGYMCYMRGGTLSFPIVTGKGYDLKINDDIMDYMGWEMRNRWMYQHNITVSMSMRRDPKLFKAVMKFGKLMGKDTNIVVEWVPIKYEKYFTVEWKEDLYPFSDRVLIKNIREVTENSEVNEKGRINMIRGLLNLYEEANDSDEW